MRVTEQLNTEIPRFVLRDMLRSDAPAWYAYLAKPEVFTHTSWNVGSVEDLLPHFDTYESDAADSNLRMAIWDDQEDCLAGTLGFHSVSALNRSAELAYDLAPAYWGQGIAAAAAGSLLAWAFGERELIRVQATVLASNAASRRVLEKLAFAYEGRLRAYRMVRGKPGDFDLFAKLHPSMTGAAKGGC